MIEQIDAENGVQIKVFGATITAYRNGNAQVQGKQRKVYEEMLESGGQKKVNGSKRLRSSSPAAIVSNYSGKGPWTNTQQAPSLKKVFIVHGHDETSLLELQHVLSKNGYDPIVLSEEMDGGDTIIEKLERVFSQGHDICAAVVLATPDDIYNDGAVARCRPNVELELGFVIARLTRKKLVYLRRSVLDTVTFTLPSDVQGVVYKAFNAGKLRDIQGKILKDLAKMTASH